MRVAIMLASTISLIVTLLFLITLLFLLINLKQIKSRKLEKSDPVLLQKFVAMCYSAGYEYEVVKIKQLFIYYIFVCAMIGYTISLLGIILGPILGVAALLIYLKIKAKALLTTYAQINDELCYSIARRLRSGEALTDSLKNVQSQYGKSKLVTHINSYIENGYSLEKAIEKSTQDSDVVSNESEKMLCGTIALAHQMGGNSARIFERIGDCFHHTYELSDDTKAALAQVKVSAMVISILPVGFLAMSSMMGLGGTSFLFTEPIGIVCLIVGLSLQAVGILWMKKMVNKGVGVWTS
jgi:tight adherence protein B